VNELKVVVPIEVYYFNQSLNFFEPIIEKTSLNVIFEKVANQQSNLKLEIRDLLNLNFSVAFYDSLFNLMSNMKQQ
jgi:hypothetical protein